MEVLKETTEWPTNVQNNTYVLSGGRLVAYMSKLTGEFKIFSKPLHFDKNYRTFEQVRGPVLEDIVLSMTI